MATFAKINDFTEQLAKGVHVFGTHAFKVVLSTVAPAATNTVLTDITQISGTNGYTTGGASTTVAISETTGTATVTGTQVTWTASGGQLVFRYFTLYNDTAASDNLVCYWDNGSTITLNDGESYTFKFNNASPGTIFTLA
jgi:hypothetical protein